VKIFGLYQSLAGPEFYHAAGGERLNDREWDCNANDDFARILEW